MIIILNIEIAELSADESHESRNGARRSVPSGTRIASCDVAAIVNMFTIALNIDTELAKAVRQAVHESSARIEWDHD